VQIPDHVARHRLDNSSISRLQQKNTSSSRGCVALVQPCRLCPRGPSERGQPG
jgi:hypothetical protein